MTGSHQAYYQTPGHFVAAAAVLSFFCILAVSLRLLARKRQRQKFGCDDALITVSTIITLAIASAMFYGVSKRGFGYPFRLPDGFEGDPFDIVTDQIVVTGKIQYIYAILLPLALGCAKLSILFFYMRIFSVNTNSATHILLVIAAVLMGSWTISFFFATVFQCKLDMWAIWSTVHDFGAHCPDSMVIDVALCASDFAFDLVLVAFPLPLIWRLNLSTTNKVTATGVFSLGGVAIVASLIRLIMQIRIMVQGLDPDADGILVITEYLYWGMIECGTGIFAACLPVMQSLFRNQTWASRLRSTRDTAFSKLFRSGRSRTTVATGPSIKLETPVPGSKAASDRMFDGSVSRLVISKDEVEDPGSFELDGPGTYHYGASRIREAV
ncbi:hypothetical protein V8F20_011681 [Naviculisporaceae sp. PSN 640]